MANRITAIREISNPFQWRHISSKDNPADIASRGMKVPDFLKNSGWLEGPRFLLKLEKDWPARYDGDIRVDTDDPEVKRETLVNSVVDDTLKATDRLVSYFSDWKRLKVAVAWFLRLKTMLLELSRGRKGLEATGNVQADQRERVKVTITSEHDTVLTPKDLEKAELAIVRYCQQQRFQDEITSLLSEKGIVSRQSAIYKLDLKLLGLLLR